MATPVQRGVSVRGSLPTIEEIREALGFPDDTHDAAIAAMLASTIAMIENYLGRGIVRATETEEIVPPDSRMRAILLWRYPVESITSVTREGVDLSGYKLYKAAGILRLDYWYRRACCDEDAALEVVYVGGYADDGLPADLVDAVMRVFYGRWNSTGGTGNLSEVDHGGAIRSVAVDGLTVTRDSPSYAGAGFSEAVIPPEIAPVAAVLDPYRARRASGV
jgi:hypothetical protein